MRYLFLGYFSASVLLAFQTGKDFVPGCTALPSALNGVHGIDKGTTGCGISGKTGATDPEVLQSKAKNNLCATGQPVDVTLKEMVALQALVTPRGITFGGDEKLPASRAALASPPFEVNGKKLHEGTLVRVAGLIKEAHHADTSSGESVNCKLKGNGNNDIHIALVEKSADAECKSVTAETIPHFRPDSWDRLGDIQKEAALTALTKDKQFRFTGQLFFDASHAPCSASCKCSGGDPARATLWEVHPVYQIEVCTKSGGCSATGAEGWTAYEKWAVDSGFLKSGSNKHK